MLNNIQSHKAKYWLEIIHISNKDIYYMHYSQWHILELTTLFCFLEQKFFSAKQINIQQIIYSFLLKLNKTFSVINMFRSLLNDNLQASANIYIIIKLI